MSFVDLGCPNKLLQFSIGLNGKTNIFNHKNEEQLISENIQDPNSSAKDQSNMRCEVSQKSIAKKSIQRQLKPPWPKLHRCSTCLKSFPTNQALTVHQVVHYDVNKRPFPCKQCSKTFQTKQNLRNHENVHSDCKPFQCAECHKCFREKSTLRKHLVTHTKMKKYFCTMCDKTFTQVSSQQRHIAKFHHSAPHFANFLPSLGAEVVAEELVLLEALP